MSIRSLNARLERLQMRAGAHYVIGQDRDRDRKRREQLFRLKLNSGLTDAQTAELAELDASFAQEDRDHRRRRELWTKINSAGASPTRNGSSTLNCGSAIRPILIIPTKSLPPN